ncbi:hypothetical protein BCR44DRAFT_1438927 [Catenaria anguillulae PL171]|uniref:Uncharacterized protein n=1 Tax=Catenaria anguillulae PL171 TaxID=765915 RepID=A0A1Y2HF55_9FUNG|nr:hypothetical protein BCR44DRAFT_1438927 [Catenaria anguillulae PL171]
MRRVAAVAVAAGATAWPTWAAVRGPCMQGELVDMRLREEMAVAGGSLGIAAGLPWMAARGTWAHAHARRQDWYPGLRLRRERG